jgi:hypothetical protein
VPIPLFYVFLYSTYNVSFLYRSGPMYELAMTEMVDLDSNEIIADEDLRFWQ